MFHPLQFRILPFFLLFAALLLTACIAQPQPLPTEATAPTPLGTTPPGQVDNPDEFVDPAVLQAALLQALAARDATTVQAWMTDPVLTGRWRGELAHSSPAGAGKLLAEQLSPQSNVTLVQDADLQALMGGQDPLTIPRQEAGVTHAFLVSGWGAGGLDEAILFVSQGPDDRVQWHGWMVIPGGFSGTRLGGLQPYTNATHGYSLFLPKQYSVTDQTPTQVAIFAQSNGDHPGGAWIAVESASGQTVEEIVEAFRTFVAGYNIPPATALDIEDTHALVLSGLPGQDFTRHLFMVRNDRLYHLTFTPEDPQLGEPYRQMEDLYAMIVNTFHFLPE